MSHAVTIVGTPLGIVARDSKAISRPITPQPPSSPITAPMPHPEFAARTLGQRVRGVSW